MKLANTKFHESLRKTLRNFEILRKTDYRNYRLSMYKAIVTSKNNCESVDVLRQCCSAVATNC